MFKKLWIRYKNRKIRKWYNSSRSKNPLVNVLNGFLKFLAIFGKIIKWTVFVVLEICIIAYILSVWLVFYGSSHLGKVIIVIGTLFYLALAYGLWYAVNYKKKKFY